MKKIFTLLSVLVISVAASAQYYQLPFVNAGQNPGGLNNDAAQPSAAPTVAPGSTDWSAAQTIPFSFDFNGTAYTSVYLAPSGIVTFTSVSGAAPSNANVALPSATIPDNSICLWGLDLSGANDAIEVKTFGTSPNRQYWIQWKSASWAGIGATSWAYWSIVLEETTNNVYIVDERNYGGTGPAITAGLQFSATSAMSVAGSPALTSTNIATGGSDEGVSDNSYYAFIQGTQPDYDAAMSNIDMPNYVQTGQGGTDVMATVTNMGAQTITDLELSYTVDNGTAVVGTVTGLSIAPGTSATVTHPTAWNPTTNGSFTIEFWASSINGNADANPADDKTDKSVITYSNSYPRTVLYETFTSSTCAPCVAGNANFEGIVANIPANELASIKYQMSWPGDGDPYNTADGNTVRGYYAINSVPRLEADGGWDGNSSSFTMGVHTDALQVPAFVSIWAEYSVDLTTNTVTTCATIEAMADLGDATLQIAIKEFETTQNVGTNGETEFFHVVKKMAPNANGQVVTITDGMNQTICTDYKFNGNFRLPNNSNDLINDATEHSVEDFNDLGVVVWLQNKASKEVYNATNAINTPVSTNSLEANVATVSVFPNPAVNNTTISIVSVDANVASVQVMDIVGKTVINMANVNLNNGDNTVDLNTASLEAGVYLIEVTINGEVSTSQLVIQK